MKAPKTMPPNITQAQSAKELDPSFDKPATSKNFIRHPSLQLFNMC
jgi:hypothetical protein